MPKPMKPSMTRLLLAALITVLSVAGCQAKPTAAPTPVPGTTAPRQVTVIGEGKVDGAPDLLTISVSLDATATEAQAASNQSGSRVTAVTNALTAQGIDPKDIATTNVTLQPQPGPDGTSIVGYRASNSLEVKVRKLDTGPQLLGSITTAGGDATRLDSVTYSIENDSDLIKAARSRAFEDAKNRAQQYADLAGIALGKVLSISETGGGAPPPSPVRYDMAPAAVPLSPGQQTVGFSVTVVWELG